MRARLVFYLVTNALLLSLCHAFSVYVIEEPTAGSDEKEKEPVRVIAFGRPQLSGNLELKIREEYCDDEATNRREFYTDANGVYYASDRKNPGRPVACELAVEVSSGAGTTRVPVSVLLLPPAWRSLASEEHRRSTIRNVDDASLERLMRADCSTPLIPTGWCDHVMFSLKSRRRVEVDIGARDLGDGVVASAQTISFVGKRRRRRRRRSASSLRRKRNGLRQLKCAKGEYFAAVAENRAAGSHVITIEASEEGSSGSAAGVSYSMTAIANVKSNVKFRMDAASGEVVTETALDRESMDEHTFNVYATSADPAVNQARCRLNIKVMDENDNRPAFSEPSYAERVKENASNGTYVLQVHADDADEGRNSEMVFSVVETRPPSARDAFRINGEGEIFVNGPIDRERVADYVLTVCARDRGLPPQSSTVQVTVSVEDLNDNAPQFSRTQYVERVREDVPVGSVVARVEATDLDEGPNGEVTYSLMRGGANRKFDIDPGTGEISLTSPLDYETDYDGFELSVRASDHAIPPRFNVRGRVRIEVLDVNDNKPRFVGLPYNVSVREDFAVGQRVLQVQAVDDDHGENSRISYAIVGAAAQLPFKIADRRRGDVLLFRALDYEKCRSYRFTVRATDSDARERQFAEERVHVTVRDVNDNAPRFDKDRYEVRVAEDSREGLELIRVRATDRDEQATVNLNYAITSGNNDDDFNIVSRANVGVIILVHQLDYNRRKSYDLTVSASDGSRTGTAQVVVSVSDRNSHRPSFESSTYQAVVREDIPVGTNVTTVHATDEDIGENARITYCFRNDSCKQCCTTQSGKYKIDKTSGRITTLAKLDYEQSIQAQLWVVARDHGQPPLEDEALVRVYLTDVNDNAPKFTQKIYRGSVRENEKRKKQKIVQVAASDADSGDNSEVYFKLQEGEDGDGNFEVDKRTGRVYAIKPLDRENVDQYKLTVVAYDQAKSSPMESTAQVIVEVIDVDDNPPLFPDDVLHFTIGEDAPLNSEIARINAVDPDISTSGSIEYEIGHDPHALSVFELDKYTGQLRLIRPLDYETRQNYTFTVSATSGELINQVVVHILVVDRNDNSPVFNDFEIHFNNYRAGNLKSFYSDVIGKVPAHDPDASDKLVYRFVSGNDGSLLIMNETTGELKLNSSLDSNRQFTAKMKIQVSDGLAEHDVNATCTLRVTGITDEMLSHSITVRVLSMNAYAFLSPLMYNFTRGLADILGTEEQNIFVFNVQNDTDVQREILNVSFSALRQYPDIYFSSKHLQNQVYLNRTKLAALTSLNVLPFDDNICLREPCQNYKRCTSILTFNSSASFISSPNMIFRPIYPVYSLKCECPIGFTNEADCTDEINMCYSKPCANGGRCQPVEGDFYCECAEGFTGKRCEVNLRGSSCRDHPGVCRNNAQCVDISGGGFECKCAHRTSNLGGSSSSKEKDEFTSLCELRSRKFKAGDFLMLPGIVNQWHFELYISFATVEPNGLIFYNGRLNHENDFLAMELVDGQIRLNFSTGQDTTVADPRSDAPLNDGQWHTVHLQYFNERKPGQLRYGVLSHHGPSKNKVVIVTVDPERCDERLTARLGLNCTRRVEQSGVKTSLDLTSPLLLGGVPNLPEEFQVRSKHFTGCLRDLVIDGQRSDLASFIANQGSVPGCASMRDHCSAVDGGACQNGGRCLTRWNGYSCSCVEGTTGINCERRSVVVRLHGVGHLSDGGGGGKLVSSIALPYRQSFSFRTRQREAILVHTETEAASSAGRRKTGSVETTARIAAGMLSYEIRADASSSSWTIASNRTRLDDGEWHFVAVDWRRMGEVVQVAINVDYGSELIDYRLTSLSLVSKIRMTLITVGGKSVGDKTLLPLDGCLQNVAIETGSGKYRVLEQALRPKHGSTPTDTCDDASVDRCATVRCPPHSECVSMWAKAECKCNKGYVGRDCRSVCELDPCHANSVCQLDAGATHGYRCACRSGYTGDQCQFRLSGECPQGWFGGDGLCAPCRCSAADNYDLNCDRSTGECRCKENHYFRSATGKCHPCDCYYLGSLGENCTDETGKCDCKKAVYGNKCDTCAYQFAEIGEEGCAVLGSDEGCPKSRYESIVWKRTKKGKQDIHKCPTGSTGFAVRKCRPDDGWSEPSFRNCTSDVFAGFADFIVKQNQEQIYLSHDWLARLAENLRETTESAPAFYARDVEISSDTVRLLLDYQNAQSGFGLTESRETAFTSDLVRTTSVIVDNQTTGYWDRFGAKQQQRADKSRGLRAPYLVHAWQEYMSTLLMNADRIHLDRATTVPAHNLRFSMNSLSSSAGGAVTHTKVPDEMLGSKVRIELPNEMFTSKRQGGGRMKRSLSAAHEEVPSITLGVMTYETIKDIFPKSFEKRRVSERDPKKPTINSEVVSFVIRYRQSELRESLSDAERERVDSIFDAEGVYRVINDKDRATAPHVVVTFALHNATNVINPLCVFWNFTINRATLDTFGAWSHRDCKRVYSNRTHVTCHCTANGTVAVITDEEITSVMSLASVYATMTIAIAISCLLLVTLVVAQLCLSAVNSVRSVVNRNLALSFALSILVFLVGIRQTADQYWCMAFAVILHFFILSNFAWIVVDVLHIYRMLTERRNVNHGHSRVYYLIGWIIPSVITALSLGLDAKGFGNSEFCWISFNDLLMWSFVTPTLISCGIFVVLFSLSLNAYLASKRVDMKREVIKHEMKSSAITTVGSLLTWLFASFAVNLNSQVYFYLFAVIVLAQSALVFLLNLWRSEEMREGYRTHRKRRAVRKERSGHNQTFEHLLAPSLGRTPDTSTGTNSHMQRALGVGGVNSMTTGAGAGSETHSSVKPSFHPGLIVPGFNADDMSDSYDDSDDDDVSSRSSMSLDSSSYSDADDEDDEEEVTQRNTLRNIRNCRVIPPSPPPSSHNNTPGTGKKSGKSANLRPRFDDEIKPVIMTGPGKPLATGNGTSRADDVMFKLTSPVVAISDEKINTDDSDETSL